MANVMVDGLYKSFHGAKSSDVRTVLHDITFEVSGHRFVSIVGPSGCGKSTLLNIISGIEPATSGSVTLQNDEGGPARLGYVFQQPRLLPWRTIRDNLLYVQDDSAQDTKDRVFGELEAVGLADYAHHYPAQLSGGMQQRAGIARAFGVDPDLLLMDEPFSHLDAITARELRAQLQEVWGKRRATVLFVTHDVVEAVELSDLVVVLEPGGYLHEILEVDLPRPRSLADEKVAATQAHVMKRLESIRFTKGRKE